MEYAMHRGAEMKLPHLSLPCMTNAARLVTLASPLCNMHMYPAHCLYTVVTTFSLDNCIDLASLIMQRGNFVVEVAKVDTDVCTIEVITCQYFGVNSSTT